MQEVHCKVTGLVQRVFFRAYSKEQADALGLTGYVKNTTDGSVEIVAQGFNEDQLKLFISKLQEGSPLSKVEYVDTKWVHSEEVFEHFLIQ